jgi:hypothetical protein
MKKWLSISILIAMLLYTANIGYKIYNQQIEIQKLKYEYSELNKINYGLFNLQLWKVKAFSIFNDHIKTFKISKGALKEAEKELAEYLYSVYEKYIATGDLFKNVFEDAEKNPKMNKMLLKLIKDNIKPQIETLNLKAYIPSMAKQLAKELKKNEPRFQDIMQSELSKLVNYDDKYSFVDPREEQFKAYGCRDLLCTNTTLKTQIKTLEVKQEKDIYHMTIAVLVFLVAAGLLYKWIKASWYISSLSGLSILLLLMGISLPMIDIDARINSVDFNLFEQDISFEEQVVFYQSKSILDVTQNLLESRGVDLKIVGIMILCFSVIFPALKLILGFFFVNFEKLRRSNFVKGMIFYLGKWSMADVFVVALFMSYIGFYGLFGNQLKALERNKGGFAIETVNHTSLAPGILFFSSYCILSIVLGIIIYREFEKKG